jgi:hypothetical protein
LQAQAATVEAPAEETAEADEPPVNVEGMQGFRSPAVMPDMGVAPDGSASPGVDFVLSGVGEVAAAPESTGEPSIDAASALPAPSFVAQARRRAWWSSRPVRGAQWLALVVLALGLALQWGLSRRDWLAAREPALAPALQLMCQVLGCRLEPYRQLEAIVIDSSAFNRVDQHAFRFSVTLRNTADMPVATPALELTLTDVQDQPLVRRVVSAVELGAPAALAARGEFSGVSALTLADDAQPSAIVGYRLMAFYP